MVGGRAMRRGLCESAQTKQGNVGTKPSGGMLNWVRVLAVNTWSSAILLKRWWGGEDGGRTSDHERHLLAPTQWPGVIQLSAEREKPRNFGVSF